MSQSSLKINNAPFALASFAAAHNALVDLIKTSQGSNGIKVFASDGKIIIDGSGVSVTGGQAASLVFDDGNVLITIDADGVKVLNQVSSDYIQLHNDASLEISDYSSGNFLVIQPSDMFYGNYAMREYSVCSNGTPANARFLSSTTY